MFESDNLLLDMYRSMLTLRRFEEKCNYLFMQGRICQQSMYLRNLAKLQRLGKVNHFMQEFFRKWHAATQDSAARGTINVSQVPIIRESNLRLLEEMNGPVFFRRFAAVR